MGYMHPERQIMTFDETVLLLRSRRTLTGQVYDDVAFNAWHTALEPWSYTEVLVAMIEAVRTESKVTVAHVVKHLPPPPPSPGPTRDAHSIACICGGRGWIETEQHDQHSTWMAWARCPNGPATGFVQIEDDYDDEAGAAAHATFKALAATAETKADIANACFAAAAAYRNTIEQRGQQ